MQICSVVLLMVVGQLWLSDAALPPQMLEIAKQQMKSRCMKKTGVSQEVLSRMLTGDFADDEKLKCYMNCCLSTSKVQTPSSPNINAAAGLKAIKQNMPEPRASAMTKQLNACKDVTGKDACDIAFQYVKCSYKIDPNTKVVPS